MVVPSKGSSRAHKKNDSIEIEALCVKQTFSAFNILMFREASINSKVLLTLCIQCLHPTLIKLFIQFSRSIK